MVEANNYRITVQRRETEDGLLFEGTVHELPDVAVYSDSFDEAYELAIDAIEGLYELAEEQGRSFPQPSTRETEFSGKFVVRVPKWLHRKLAVAAEENGTSLNQFMVSVLSFHESLGKVAIQYSEHPETSIAITPTFVSSASPATVHAFEGIMVSISELMHPGSNIAIGDDVGAMIGQFSYNTELVTEQRKADAA